MAGSQPVAQAGVPAMPGEEDDASRGVLATIEEPVKLPQLSPLEFGRYLWRQLTSMRTALVLLVLLAVAAVPGSIVPQRGVDPTGVAQYLTDRPALGRWLDRFGFFDVYASPWFAAVYLLLFVSLIGCVLPRCAVYYRALRGRPVRTPRRLDRMAVYRELTVAASPQDVLGAAAANLKKRGWRVEVRAGADADQHGPSLSAESGYLREFGNLVFHLSLIGVLVAVAVGALYGYRGQVLVPVGGSFANSLVSYDTFDPGSQVKAEKLPPFRLTLDDLQVRFETDAGGNQFAAPRDFQGRLSVVDGPGSAPRPVDLAVNNPLQVAGAQVHLAGNGYAPVITVRDGRGQVAYSGPTPFIAQDAFYTSTGVIKVPDAAPRQLGIRATLLPTMVDSPEGPRSAFPDSANPRIFVNAYVGDLGLDSGVPQSVYRLDTTKMTQLQGAGGRPFVGVLAPGETVDLPDGAGSVTFESLPRFAGLGIRHDPARVWALVFSVVAMLALAVSLFVQRRRLWVRVEDSGEVDLASAGPGTVVRIAALSRGEDARLDRQTDAVADQLSARFTVLGTEDRE